LQALLEPTGTAGLGVAVKQPPVVRIRPAIGFRGVGAAVRQLILPGRRVADGGARPLGGLELRAGAAWWAAGWRFPPDARATSYLARRIPSTTAIPRHCSEWRDELTAGRENPAGRPLRGQMPEELLTQRQLAEELQVSLRTLERWRQEGTGPAFIRVGRSPRYRRSDIDAWLDRQRRGQRE
jgi:excisionase family DNA binding protein